MEHRLLRTLPVALLAAALTLGCATREEPARAPSMSSAAPVTEQVNAWTPQSPQEKWWERATACPPGAALVGDVPPKGWVLECRTPDNKRNGRSSVWFPSGDSGTYSEYENDVPHGRWLYWLHNQRLVEGHFDHGRREGAWTYFFDSGSGFDTGSRWDARNARPSVIESYDHGLLVRTVHYRDGAPID